MWITFIVLFVFVGLLAKKYLVPKPIPGIPLLSGISTITKFGKNPNILLREARQKYGDCFTVDLFLLRMTFVFGSDAVNKFFKSPESEMTLKSVQRFVKAIIGPDTNEPQPDVHKYITEGFLKGNRMQYYIDNVRREMKKQLDRLASMDSFDLFPEISRIVVLMNIVCCLGEEAANEHGEDFARSYYDIEMNAFNPLPLIAPWLPIASNKIVQNSRKRLLAILASETAKRLANKQKYENNMDYLQMNINMAQNEGYPTERYPDWFSRNLIGLLFAAHTNTAGTFAWTLAHIGSSSKFQDRARTECKSVLASDNNNITMSTLSKLEFLDCAMKETVRSYAMLYLTRRVITPVTIGGHEIPKEEIVAVSPYYVHHDAANYADPDTYDPARFAGSAGLKHVEDKTYIQFGYGPHRCLGEKFANIVLKTGWLELFSNYNVEILTPIPQADLTSYWHAVLYWLNSGKNYTEVSNGSSWFT